MLRDREFGFTPRSDSSRSNSSRVGSVEVIALETFFVVDDEMFPGWVPDAIAELGRWVRCDQMRMPDAIAQQLPIVLRRVEEDDGIE